MTDVVIVGTLADWPLAQRLSKLVSLPEAHRVPCYQAVGSKTHCAAVSKAVFRREERPSAVIAASTDALLAVVEACTEDRAGLVKLETTFGFHGSATLERVRGDLAKFEVLAPADALAGRRPTPGAARKGIAKALADRSIPQRKALRAFLEGDPFSEVLLQLDAHDLSYGFTTWAETLDETNRRLLFLWARCALQSSMFPMPSAPPELGFDRFGAWVEELTGVGVRRDVALEYVLVHSAQHSRWWASTGVYVWERLAENRAGFIERVRSASNGDRHLANVLMSVAWLPKDLLAPGGRALLREVCATPSLVPAASFAALLEDDEAREALGDLRRVKQERTATGAAKVARPIGIAARLMPPEDEASRQARLEKLGAAVAVPAPSAAKPLTKAAVLEREKAAAARVKKVVGVLRELARRAPGRRAVPATTRHLKGSIQELLKQVRFAGPLSPEASPRTGAERSARRAERRSAHPREALD